MNEEPIRGVRGVPFTASTAHRRHFARATRHCLYHRAMESGRTTRRYASSIAIVSGLYAVWSVGSAMVGSPMMPEGDAGVGIGTTVMGALGVAVLLHGIVLASPAADDIGIWSGPLMIAWGSLMLANQGLSAVTPAWSMAGIGWDAGMVALAALMMASGIFMREGRPSQG